MRIDDLQKLAEQLPNLALRDAFVIVEWVMARETTISAGTHQIAPVSVAILQAAIDEAPSSDGPPPGPIVTSAPAMRTKGKRGRPWTAQDHEIAMRMRSAGSTHREIAERLGRTVRAVQLYFHKQRAVAAPEKPSQPPDEVDPVLDRFAQLSENFTEADDVTLAEQLAAGVSPGAIADQLGCKAIDVSRRFLDIVEMATGKRHVPGPSAHAVLIKALRRGAVLAGTNA